MNPELMTYLQSQGYKNIRMLEDDTYVGTMDLLFTRALFIDLTFSGWDKRFCFQDRDLAVTELEKLRSGDDEPSGYIARRNS